MNRLPQFLGMVVFGLALLVSAGVSQETKKDDKKPDEKKKKANLPQGFKDLGLSLEQKTKIYSVQGSYSTKISALADQIKDLRKKEQQEIVEILTDEQREKYLKAKGFENKDKKGKDKDKSKEKDKDKN